MKKLYVVVRVEDNEIMLMPFQDQLMFYDDAVILQFTLSQENPGVKYKVARLDYDVL